MQADLRQTTEIIAKALVEDTSSVDVRETGDPQSIRIEVRVAESDVGKIIGRQGRTIKAIRSVLHVAGVKHNRRYLLDVVE